MLGCVQEQKIPKDTLVIGIESEVKNLNPITTLDANGWNSILLYAQGLMRIGDNLLPENDLAVRSEIIGDRVFKFELPKAATFHNGRPLSCEDVKFSYVQAAGPTSRAQASLKDIEALDCPDPSHFVIRLKRPDPAFVFNVIKFIRILPMDLAVKREFDTQPIGSGPFRFVERRNRDLIFERFDNFQSFDAQGKRRPLSAFRHVIVRSVQDPTTRHLSLEGGDLDIVINATSPRKVHEMTQNKNLQVHRGPGTTFQYIGLNMRNPKFRNPKVRWALSHAIPRELIIAHKLKGYALPAAGLFSPQSFFHDPTLQAPEYNLETAKRLLKESGVKDLTVEIKSSTDRDVASFLLIIKEEWEKLGIKVEIRPFEFATFFTQVQRGDFEAYSLRWTSMVEPDMLYRIYHSKEIPPGRNRVYYKNLEVDRLLEATKDEMNLTQRRALYFRAQSLIYADSPYLPLWHPDNVAITQKNLRGFKMIPTAEWRAALEAYKE